jgi:hypothetical protein
MSLQERTITGEEALRTYLKVRPLPIPLRERVALAWRELGYTDPEVIELKVSQVVRRIAEDKFKGMPPRPTAH